MSNPIETDVLIVGAGPAGASAAVFLAPYGLRTIMICRHPCSADTPRAHITNQRAMEAFRDAGLEPEITRRASPAAHIEHTFWLRSMGGEELARTHSWGNDPQRIGDYAAGSPCEMCDLPQTELEPILVGEAARRGVKVRFDTELIDFEQDADGVTARIRDRLTGGEFDIRARYMIGADGARSRIVEKLGIPLTGMSGLGDVFNVLCDVDLEHHVRFRHGSLYSVIQPGSSQWAPVGVFRMVKPWNQWLVGLIVPPTADRPEPTQEEFKQRIQELIGDPDIPVEILSTSVWSVNDLVADYYRDGRIFCMGDAVHRHPPTNGLGSNTCVQDAFNLAWKLGLVANGKADEALLESYNAERQPVGKQIVARANKSMAQNNLVWDLLGGGMRSEPCEGGHETVFETPEGREQLRCEIDKMRFEYHAHGVEMNRRYVSGAIVPGDGEAPEYERNPELYYQPSTWPGSSLPHVWLGDRNDGRQTSTLDVAGKSRFMLFTGPGGDAWRSAADELSEEFGVEIAVTSIGAYQDYEDSYRRWHEVSGIAEDGCVLARPDLIVAWRCGDAPDDPVAALRAAMASILGLTEATA